MPKSIYFVNVVLNVAVRHIAYSSPTTVYVALYNNPTPSPTTSGAEVGGGGYARQPVTFTTPLNGGVSNNVAITFPVATDNNWGKVEAFGILDEPTAGHLLYYGSLSQERIMQQNDQLIFPIGQLTFVES